jgi:hypothetical protein
MINKLIITVVLTFISMGLFADEVPTCLNYRSFYDRVITGDFSEFTIYKNYRSDVRAVAKDKSGREFIVDRPYRYEEDDIFMEHLKTKGVSVTILDDVYKGKTPEKSKYKSRMILVGSLVYLIPIALIVAIVLMAKTISRQAKIIESLTKNGLTEPSDLA